MLGTVAIGIQGPSGVGAPLLTAEDAAGIEAGDPRRSLIGSCAGDLATPGSASARFLDSLENHIHGSPSLRLRDLPPDVAQAILDSRAESMEAFFSAWNESIERNAWLDKEAASRRRLLAAMLGSAVTHGEIEAPDAERWARNAGLITAEQGVDVVEALAAAANPGAAAPNATTQPALLQPEITTEGPGLNAVSLRRR